MDFFFHTHQNQKHVRPPKHNKKRLNPDQVRLLERSFTSNNKLDAGLKLELAKQLRIPQRQVAVWFQNRRARGKNQSLELHYNALQQQLQNALVEKRRLEKDLERLKGELEKAREMALALKQTGPRVSCKYSISFDESGSSLENGGFLPIDDQELFACLINGEDGSSWE
ncbi:homeobox-leucine zipper protein ATHB-52-like [Alnus glutinosa]|uniref:homeobox-leucine zipper protein ATHB-52-like n=1 Tax=Alnus glutinosa TaxID=3517 RepID=UPI002D79F242|nr:homeobox-leucine zipper protein ATHB-52-like [Alnus glutinosa]